MTELEQLRLELAELRKSTQKALALTAHCIAAQGDAAPLLYSLMANYRQAAASGATDSFDELMAGVLLAVSSVALKQRPDDPAIQAEYRNLRAGPRH